jgi:hypothetical protein
MVSLLADKRNNKLTADLPVDGEFFRPVLPKRLQSGRPCVSFEVKWDVSED